MSNKEWKDRKSKVYREVISTERGLAFEKLFPKKSWSGSFPLYCTRFRNGEFEILDQMGITLNEILHAEQEYTYENDLKPGSEITFQTVLSNCTEKKSKDNTLTFFLFETEVFSADHKTRHLISRSTMVMRKALT